MIASVSDRLSMFIRESEKEKKTNCSTLNKEKERSREWKSIGRSSDREGTQRFLADESEYTEKKRVNKTKNSFSIT